MRGSSIERLILFEDNHLVIINKPPGEIVQGDRSGDIPLSDKVKRWIKERYDKPGNVYLGVVHRIDRPVSGVVMFARTSKALTRLNLMLREGRVGKTYWAVVRNPPPAEEGALVHFLTRNEKQNKTYVRERDIAGSQRAELHYRLLARSDRYFLLEVDLLTGRHHQIRAQLAHMGCPIRGDLKYGYPRSNPDGSIHLHARRVTLVHPVKEVPLEILAPPPGDRIWNYFSAMNL
jgi:23S rRNA pseudouridine1911/1915/1917 synthase